MTEELQEKNCPCTDVATFIRIIFASFLGCILAILLVGAFMKPKMAGMPCPYMHKMFMKKMMDKMPNDMDSERVPFAKKFDKD